MATHQLIQQKILSEEQLIEKNHNRIYDLDLHEAPVHEWLQNIFLRLKHTTDFNRIHDQKRYFFSALVQEFYGYIKAQVMPEKCCQSNEIKVKEIQKKQGMKPAWLNQNIEESFDKSKQKELQKRLNRIDNLRIK